MDKPVDKSTKPNRRTAEPPNRRTAEPASPVAREQNACAVTAKR